MSANLADAAERRSRALRELGIFNLENVEPFDAIVQLAANLCDTPMAALSFNDQSRERFVACRGFSLDKIPTEKGLSDYIVSGGTPIVVNDTRIDMRFRNAPLLKVDVGVRFYAGAPVITSDGIEIGTLAVMDRGVRHLPQEKLAALATLGTQVALLLESNRKPGSPKPGISLRPTNIIDSRFALDTVFSSLPGLYWLLEPEELRVIAVSDSALDTVGGKREDVVGRNIEDALREMDAPTRTDVDKAIASMKRVATTGKEDRLVMLRYHVPARNPEQEVEERFWNIVNAPIRDAGGKLMFIVNRAEDATELARLRERDGKAAKDHRLLEGRARQMEKDVLAHARETERLNEHLRMAQSVAAVGSWEIGIDNAWYFWSDEVITVLGVNPKDHPPTDDIILDATHPDDRKLLLETRAAAIDGTSEMDITHRIVHTDGSVRYVQQQARLVFDGEGAPVKLYGTIQNITRQRQVEQELLTRASQQETVAKLGQNALSVKNIETLWQDAVKVVAKTLDVEYCKILQLLPDNSGVKLMAGVGWKKGLVGKAVVGIARNSQAGYTLLSNEPVIVKDLRSETRFDGPALLHDHGVVSGISVIIAGKDGPWGVLGAHSTHIRPFTQDDVNFFESIANIIAEANYRASVIEERDALVRHHRALLELTRSVVQGCTLRELQNLATRLVTEVLGVEYSNIKELLADGSGMQVVAGTGWQKGVVGHAVLASGKDSHGGLLMRTGKPLTVTDLPNEKRFRPSSMLLDHGVDSSASVLVAGRNGPWGLLGAYTTRRRWFTHNEVSFLENIAEVLAEFGASQDRNRASSPAAEGGEIA